MDAKEILNEFRDAAIATATRAVAVVWLVETAVDLGKGAIHNANPGLVASASGGIACAVLTAQLGKGIWRAMTSRPEKKADRADPAP